MPSFTTNYNLEQFDRTADATEKFIDFRDAIGGTGNNNLQKIDNQMKQNADDIADLAGGGRTTETVVDNANDISTLQTRANVSGFYSVTTSGVNSYTATNTYITSYTDKMKISITFGTENTDASTININTIGTVALKTRSSNDFVAGELKTNRPYLFEYNGVNFVSCVEESLDYTTHTQSVSQDSLPTNTVNAPVTNISATGLSIVQSVTNGDFSNGTTGWTPISATHSETSKVYSLTGDGTGSAPSTRKSTGITTNAELWFLYAKTRVTNAVSVSTKLFVRDGATYVADVDEQLTPTINQWYELYGTYTTSSIDDFNVAINHAYADATTANGKVMEIDGNAGVLAINMTALGISGKTEAEMLDLVHGGYFEGLKSNENPILSTVGKNLFDETYEQGTIGTDGTLSDSTQAIRTKNLIKVNAGQTYVKSNSLSIASGRIAFYLNNTFVSAVTDVSSFTVPNGANQLKYTIYRVSGITPDDIVWSQLEKGSIATDYEPYKSSTIAVVDNTFRSLPNGIVDKLSLVNGKWYKEKNIIYDTFVSSNFASLNTALTNVDRVWTTTNFKGLTGTSGVDGKFIIEGFNCEVASADVDSVNSEYCYYFDASGVLQLIVPKGMYANLSEAQADLTGKYFQYQLATPETIDITPSVSGQLTSYKDGTLYNNMNNVLYDYSIPLDITAQIAVNDASKLEECVNGINENAKDISFLKEKTYLSGNKNYLINGAFDIWQRGDTFANPANGTYTSDRWVTYLNVDNNYTIFKDSPVENGFKNSLRMEATASGAIGARSDCIQLIEDFDIFKGEEVTASYKVKIDEGVDAVLYIAVDGVQVAVKYVYGTGKIETYALTTTIPTGTISAMDVRIRLLRDSISTGEGLNIQWMKLELGEVATPFVPKAYAEELQLCQRYYYPIPAFTVVRCSILVSDVIYFNIPVPVDMRTVPTLITGTEGIDWDVQTLDQTVQTGFSLSLLAAEQNNFLIIASKNPHGLTDASFRTLTQNGNAFDAEL